MISNGLSENAKKVIAKRYSKKDEQGNPTETWEDIVHRVVLHVAEAESDPIEKGTFVNNLRELMLKRVFVPNTPCLVNAGANDRAFAGCYVLPVGDSIKEIMGAATYGALIHQSGGGTGYSFGKLRPAGSLVKTTFGIASGPVSFMEIFDKVTDVVKQGGVRRGANMGILPVDHPDILRFIHAKNDQKTLTNFNISVAITDEFMKAVKNKEWYQTKFNGEPWTKPVHDPLRSGEYWWIDENSYSGKIGQLYAPDVWNRIIESAHKWAEPGIIFIDEVNRHNLLIDSMGPISSSNPCGEQYLHDYNSCNLGSIDVSKFYCPDWNGANSRTGQWTAAGNFHWESFAQAIYWSVRFLDNVIDTCVWPLQEIEDVVKRTRPVGLGIMGFADLLLKLKIRYGSDESVDFLSQLMDSFQREAWKASLLIGKEKGEFPEYKNNKGAYDKFFWEKMEFDALTVGNDPMEFGECYCSAHYHPRNYEVTNIAPTGTISLVAECSSGIEPNFAWTYTRSDTVGTRSYVHPLAAEQLGITSQDPHTELIISMNKLPDYFVTAHEVTPEEHIKVLAAAQQYVDNGVSKTCNGSRNDSVEDVRKLYEMAHELGVKSVSYYRDGCREGQVLTTKPFICPECKEPLQEIDSCQTCVNCGFGKCSL